MNGRRRGPQGPDGEWMLAKKSAMGSNSLLFWGLAAAVALVSLRWGAMIGLIVFVLALTLGAAAIARWAPPQPSALADRVFLDVDAARSGPTFLRTPDSSERSVRERAAAR